VDGRIVAEGFNEVNLNWPSPPGGRLLVLRPAVSGKLHDQQREAAKKKNVNKAALMEKEY
jgi:hypothetical protein